MMCVCARRSGTPLPVFVWLGPDASTVEVHLSARTVAVYLEQCRDGRGHETHSVRVTKGHEPLAFKALFHGWSEEARREAPTNEFLRNERLIQGRVLDGPDDWS
jgi:hypothetical protein